MHRQGVTIGGVSFSEDTERDLSLSQTQWSRDNRDFHSGPDSSQKPLDDSLEQSLPSGHGALAQTAPASLEPLQKPLDDSLEDLPPVRADAGRGGARGQKMSQTIAGDDDAVRRLQRLQQHDEEDGVSKAGRDTDDVLYSDEEDAGGGRAGRKTLQKQAAEHGGEWHAVFGFARHNKKTETVAALERGCPVDLKDEHGNTLLNIAAQNGHKSLIKTLLRRGANLNSQNHKGQTALHFCFTYGFSDLGSILSLNPQP